jgi:predicted DNA-binding helix-hairpin-helix protein
MNYHTFYQRLELAESPETPSEILDEIFDYLNRSLSENCYLLSAIIENPNTELKTLNKILKFLKFRDFPSMYIQISPKILSTTSSKCR